MFVTLALMPHAYSCGYITWDSSEAVAGDSWTSARGTAAASAALRPPLAAGGGGSIGCCDRAAAEMQTAAEACAAATSGAADGAGEGGLQRTGIAVRAAGRRVAIVRCNSTVLVSKGLQTLSDATCEGVQRLGTKNRPAADELEPQIHGRLLGRVGAIVLVIAARLRQLSGRCLHRHGAVSTRRKRRSTM